AAKLVSGETVEYVARQLAAMHQPAGEAAPCQDAGMPRMKEASAVMLPAKVKVEPTLAPSLQPSLQSAALPPCKACGGRDGEVCYGKFGYYFKCKGCQANTAIRFTCLPGHAPRLRKAGLDFYRDCAECGSKELIHRNTAEPGQ